MNVINARRHFGRPEATRSHTSESFYRRRIKELVQEAAETWHRVESEKRDLTAEEKQRLQAGHKETLWLWDRVRECQHLYIAKRSRSRTVARLRSLHL